MSDPCINLKLCDSLMDEWSVSANIDCFSVVASVCECCGMEKSRMRMWIRIPLLLPLPLGVTRTRSIIDTIQLMCDDRSDPGKSQTVQR